MILWILDRFSDIKLCWKVFLLLILGKFESL